jgi:endothelin-converting enzyme/putative endopeptidase
MKTLHRLKRRAHRFQLFARTSFLIVLAVGGCFAQEPARTDHDAALAAATVTGGSRWGSNQLAIVDESAATVSSEPQLSHFSLDNLDLKTDPCVDFYQYACGGWITSNPAPPDQVWWDTISALQDRNESLLREIAEKSMPADPKRDALHQKIGDYYAACMDEGKIEAAGARPIEAELRRIFNIKAMSDVADELGRFHRMLYLTLEGGVFPSLGDPGSREALFGSSPWQDYEDASKIVAFLDQGGLGLPDRDYYLRDDKDSVELRKKYVAHIRKTLALLGADSDPDKAANRIMQIETDLARSWMDAVTRRERHNLNNRYSREDLQHLMPRFDWTKFLTAAGAPPSEHYLVASPEFFKTLNSLLGSVSIGDWRAYLRWSLLRASAAFLSKAFAMEDFEFYGKDLTGAKEPPPRWKRCIWATDRDLRDSLSQAFVEQSFHEADKQDVLQIVRQIEMAFDGVIKENDWLAPATRNSALSKLSTITNRIGYPERWRDYSSLDITRESWATNAFRSSEYEVARQLGQIGKSPDRNDWWMTATTLDAYNNPRLNSVTFPAGFLGAPVFDRSGSAAINFGAFGTLAGHEITHGFDSMGRKYDALGNLHDWWTVEDSRRFEDRSACLVDQYSDYVVADNVKLNGKFTLSENIADLVGARLAFLALKNQDKESARGNGDTGRFTPEQQFFLSYALRYCSNVTPETLKLLASSDPHADPKHRVNGVVSNMPEFQKAFHCKAGQPMVRANQCRIW